MWNIAQMSNYYNFFNHYFLYDVLKSNRAQHAKTLWNISQQIEGYDLMIQVFLHEWNESTLKINQWIWKDILTLRKGSSKAKSMKMLSQGLGGNLMVVEVHGASA